MTLITVHSITPMERWALSLDISTNMHQYVFTKLFSLVHFLASSIWLYQSRKHHKQYEEKIKFMYEIWRLNTELKIWWKEVLLKTQIKIWGTTCQQIRRSNFISESIIFRLPGLKLSFIFCQFISLFWVLHEKFRVWYINFDFDIDQITFKLGSQLENPQNAITMQDISFNDLNCMNLLYPALADVSDDSDTTTQNGVCLLWCPNSDSPTQVQFKETLS